MQAPSRRNVGQDLAVNSFLLCSVLAKQARRLRRLLPDRRIAELIAVAMKNCADYEIGLELCPDAPQIVRTEAMQIGRLTRRMEPSAASSFESKEASKAADVISVTQKDAREDEPADEGSLPRDGANRPHVSVGSHVDSLDSRRNLFSVQRVLRWSLPMVSTQLVSGSFARLLTTCAH